MMMKDELRTIDITLYLIFIVLACTCVVHMANGSKVIETIEKQNEILTEIVEEMRGDQ